MAQPKPTAVQAEGLRFSFGEKSVLDGVSFGVSEGELFGVLGPNGSGKTTLFRILSTLLAPSGGSASILGFDLQKNSDEVRKSIGVVFQSPSVDSRLTVRENIMCQGHMQGLSGRRLADRMEKVLSRFGLTDRRNEMVESLSGGFKRRVELAKSLLHSPRVLLLDEPSAGLDPGARRDLWSALREVRAEGISVLLTTHLMDEAETCDRLVLLNEGRIVAMGSPADLKAEMPGEIVAFETTDSAAFVSEIRKRFTSLHPRASNGRVYLENVKWNDLYRDFETLLPLTTSVTTRKPTLEDLFLKRTGHSFWGNEIL